MSVPLVINGVTFDFPSPREENWAEEVIAWAQAVSSGLLQKAGGTFTLTADANFGTNFGLKAKYLKDSTGTIADAEGFLRLANNVEARGVSWRNAANDDNCNLYVNGDDDLVFVQNGVPINLSAGTGGDVQGPGASTDNAIVRWNGVGGIQVLNSGVTLNDDDEFEDVADVKFVGPLSLLAMLPPVGTIIAFYDFDGDLTFDTDYWKPCDGSTQTIGGVSRTMPDLSGRYLVGFGTDGGGDNDTAPWATTPVGNAGHEVDISHTHTVNSHTHTMAHTHTVAAHTHTVDAHEHTLTAACAQFDFNGTTIFYNRRAEDFTSDQRIGSISDDGTASSNRSNAMGLAGSTDDESLETNANSTGTVTGASSAANTGSATPGTSTSGSATQSIQPRSVRVRFFMRAI